ncbi:MAG: DUF2281 domain-containing protein [Symploca sp. SIO1B1]|nr:DUF2281 domain-containing protein [Symploca sp. SIO1B1]
MMQTQQPETEVKFTIHIADIPAKVRHKLEQAKKRPPLFGIDKGKISITDDFDKPLEDFRDY